MPPEAKQKIRDAKKNVPQETRDKIGKALKGRKPWNKGHTAAIDKRVAENTKGGWKHTEESKQLMREKKKGKTPVNKGQTKDTLESIRRGAEKLRGIPKTPETIEKNRIAHLGKIPHNKGKNKYTYAPIQIGAMKASNTVFEQYKNGRKVWCDGRTSAEDERITGNKYSKGNTKETCEKLKIAGEKQSITKVEMFKNGELSIWSLGYNKNTHPSVNRISEARIDYMRKNGGRHISKREDKFSDWFESLGLIKGKDFIRQYLLKDMKHKYLLDFYFPKINLVIEFDGEFYHRYKREEDRQKTQELKDKGCVVLRFLETIRKNHPIEEANAKENIMKILKYVLEDKNGNN